MECVLPRRGATRKRGGGRGSGVGGRRADRVISMDGVAASAAVTRGVYGRGGARKNENGKEL